MPKSTLVPPPAALPPKLLTKTLSGNLLRISRRTTGEPYFGKSGANRFDDPTPDPANRYGVCYAGRDLATAVGETLLHDQEPNGDSVFDVAVSEIQSRYLVKLKIVERLVLVDMTGPQLKALAGGGELSTVTPYTIPQAWSRALYNHPQQFDGIYYISRHLNDRPGLALFDRAAPKLQAQTYTRLEKVPSFAAVTMMLRIAYSY